MIASEVTTRGPASFRSAPRASSPSRAPPAPAGAGPAIPLPRHRQGRASSASTRRVPDFVPSSLGCGCQTVRRCRCRCRYGATLEPRHVVQSRSSSWFVYRFACFPGGRQASLLVSATATTNNRAQPWQAPASGKAYADPLQVIPAVGQARGDGSESSNKGGPAAFSRRRVAVEERERRPSIVNQSPLRNSSKPAPRPAG